MPPLPPDREEGWEAWLREFDLWDDTHTEERAYRRYLTFSRVKFGAAPRDVWPKLFGDLLEFESSLVFGSGHIGLVNMPFNFRVTDPRPIRETAIPYPKAERAWLRQYCEEQCRLGVLREVKRGIEPDPVFIETFVLVRGGQSAQDYRACANLVRTNTRLAPSGHPAAESAATLDMLQGCNVFSALDMKAGFHNIPIPAHLQKYAGVVTQDKLYCWCRMPFGFNMAPAHF